MTFLLLSLPLSHTNFNFLLLLFQFLFTDSNVSLNRIVKFRDLLSLFLSQSTKWDGRKSDQIKAIVKFVNVWAQDKWTKERSVSSRWKHKSWGVFSFPPLRNCHTHKPQNHNITHHDCERNKNTKNRRAREKLETRPHCAIQQTIKTSQPLKKGVYIWWHAY